MAARSIGFLATYVVSLELKDLCALTMNGAKTEPPARTCLASACVRSAQLAARVETFQR